MIPKGKTYAAKGLVEQLLDQQARVCVVDPLGVWWGLRSAADGAGPGYPVVVFGGRHADVPISEAMGAALGRLIGTHAIACVVDLSELGSSAARRRFMTAFAESVYEANDQPLHLVLDEADLWAPQRPRPEGMPLLGRIEEIVRRGRVRGFIPWLITQRPAVVAKDVLSQADILVMMKLISSQDREAVGRWLDGQGDRADGRRILAELPRLARGEGYLWAPSSRVLERVAFPAIRTFDSSRTPQRGEQMSAPGMLAEVDLSTIWAELAMATADEPGVGTPKNPAGPDEQGRGRTAPQRGKPTRGNPVPTTPGPMPTRQGGLPTTESRMLETAHARIAALEAEVAVLHGRLERIALLAAGADIGSSVPAQLQPQARPAPPSRTQPRPRTVKGPGDALHPAARKLLAALAQHAPARFTWGQAATLAGLKPSGGHFNAGRKLLRDLGLVEEAGSLAGASLPGLRAAGEVPSMPTTPAERMAVWCARLPSPAPEMLRSLAAHGGGYTEVADLAADLGRKPSGGHWNTGLALLRNNGLIEVSGKRLRVSVLFR